MLGGGDTYHGVPLSPSWPGRGPRRGVGVPTLDRRVPTLDRGGVPTLDKGEGYLPRGTLPSWPGWGEGYYLGRRKGTYLGVPPPPPWPCWGYLPWMGGGTYLGVPPHPDLVGGRGTYLGQGIPTLDRGGVPTLGTPYPDLLGRGVPTLDGGGSTYLGQEDGYLPWGTPPPPRGYELTNKVTSFGCGR